MSEAVDWADRRSGNERRSGGDRRVAEPCAHERDWVRMEQVVERHEVELKNIGTTGAETKVYMKQVLEAQVEMKESIKGVLERLNLPFATHGPAPETQQPLIQKMIPQLLDLLKWAIIIIGALVGVGEFMK